MNKLPCDYAACDGTINAEPCPQRESCLRHVGVQPECSRQVWMTATVAEQYVGACPYYIEVKK